jgi:hypothetical protein
MLHEALDADALVHSGDGRVVQGLGLGLGQCTGLPHGQRHDRRDHVRATGSHVLRREDVGLKRLHLL